MDMLVIFCKYTHFFGLITYLSHGMIVFIL